MKVVCISASNVRSKGNQSISTMVCRIIEKSLQKGNPSILTETVALMDYNLSPCIMCGACSKDYSCIYDSDFNELFSMILAADGIVIVCPHYAPIPAKLTMLLEKLEEFCYLAWCRQVSDSWPLKGKYVGLIAHGGQTGEVHDLYKQALLDPLESVFKAIGMNVVEVDEEYPNGITFGVIGYQDKKDIVFPDMVHDLDEIEQKATKMAKALLNQL